MSSSSFAIYFFGNTGLLFLDFELDIIRDHFKSMGLSIDHMQLILNPDDQQDVKMAFDMLKDVWSLPHALTNQSPGFIVAYKAL